MEGDPSGRGWACSGPAVLLTLFPPGGLLVFCEYGYGCLLLCRDRPGQGWGFVVVLDWEVRGYDVGSGADAPVRGAVV